MLAEFLRWWADQLGELIPASLRRRWQGRRNTVTVHLAGDSASFDGPAGTSSGVHDLPVEGRSAESPVLADFLDALPGPPERLRLVLEPDQYLRRDLSMPRAARPHLAEAVGYQLPKLTPFTTDQALYACGENADGATDGPLSAWLVVVPKAKISRALSLIAQNPPANPLRVERPPQPGERLELSWRIAESGSSSSSLMRIAWLGLIAVWGGALALHLYNRHDASQQLEQTLDGLRNEAAQVSALRDRVNITAARLDWLSQRKRAAQSTIALLDSLAQQLDDDTWLQRLQFDGKEVTLMGISSTPSVLVETLESSSAFEGVRIGAFTRDRRNNADRFNLTASIESPPAGAGQ
jgi:general secretion pathway protein L